MITNQIDALRHVFGPGCRVDSSTESCEGGAMFSPSQMSTKDTISTPVLDQQDVVVTWITRRLVSCVFNHSAAPGFGFQRTFMAETRRTTGIGQAIRDHWSPEVAV